MTWKSYRRLFIKETIPLIVLAVIVGLVGYVLRDNISAFLGIYVGIWYLILIAILLIFSLGILLIAFPAQRKGLIISALEGRLEEVLPSTPYELFLDHLWHAKRSLLVCFICILTLIPIIIFMKDLEILQTEWGEITTWSTGPTILRFVLSLFVANLFVFLVAVIKMRRISNNPFARTYRSIREKPPMVDNAPSHVRLVNTLSSEVKVKPPRLLVTETPISPSSFSFGKTEEDAQIIFYKDYLKTLGRNELKAVILHELWHVKTDIQVDFLKNVEREYFWWHISGQTLLFLAGLFGVPALALATSSIEWPYRIRIFGMPLPILANPMVFLFSVIPQLVGIFTVISGILFQPKLFKLSLFSWEQQEYFMDSMTILTTKQPMTLMRAILRDVGLRAPSRGRLTSELLEDIVASDEFSLNVSGYNKLLQPTLLKDRPELHVNRIKQARLIDALLKGHFRLQVKRKLASFSSFNIFGLSLRLYSSPFVKALEKVDKSIVRAVYEYILSNAEKFNLVECAESSGANLNEAFIVFVCLLMGGLIEEYI